MLNFSNLNYLSIKYLSCLPTHSTPPPAHVLLLQLCRSPGYYLITLKVSQKPGSWPKVSKQGATTWQMRTAVCLAVFFQALLYTE